MEYKKTTENDSVHITLGGDIDEYGAEVLEKNFQELDLEKSKKIIFDFSAVRHIGSAGIGRLLLLYKESALKGGEIFINHPSSIVYELLEVVKLNTIFTITR